MIKPLVTKDFYRIILFLFVLVGSVLRLYNLNWADSFVHPDELNIGYAVSNIHVPDNANPEFFAYGSFPIYVTYAAGVLQNIFKGAVDVWFVSVEQALTIGRHLSALTSIILIPLIYYASCLLGASRGFALTGATLYTFLIGNIQFAHFATFETFLTCFYVLTYMAAINAYAKSTFRSFLLLGIIIGLTIGTKIVSLYLIGLPIGILFLQNISKGEKLVFKDILSMFHLPRSLINNLAGCMLAIVCTFFITNPFVALDYASFVNSLNYERGVATGTLPVFYTRNFNETVPFVYQLRHVLPFLSGYIFVGIGTVAVTAIALYGVRTIRRNPALVLFLYVFLGYTAFHMSMFVKWSRYMIPALVLLVIAVIYVASKLYLILSKQYLKTGVIVIVMVLIAEVVFRGVSFFTIYTQPDSRQRAAQWLTENISPHQAILSEALDPNIIPFNASLGVQITLIDMYELDESETSYSRLARTLETTDYILLPSDRVSSAALRLPHRYPIAANYYTALFAGDLGFTHVYETAPRACIIPEHISKRLPNAVEVLLCPTNIHSSEGTFYVFDHPTVHIFKKNDPLDTNTYENLLKGGNNT